MLTYWWSLLLKNSFHAFSCLREMWNFSFTSTFHVTTPFFLPHHQRPCMSFPLKNWWEFEPFLGLEIPEVIVEFWFSLFVPEVYWSLGAMLFFQQNPPSFIVWFEWCSINQQPSTFCISSSLWYYLPNVSMKMVYQFYSEDFERQWNENTIAGKAAEMLPNYT